MKKMYLLPFGIQKNEIDEFCFNRCKEIIFNKIVMFEGHACSVCRKDDCPFEEKRIEIGECELDSGEIEFVILRKLKKING